MSPLQQVDLPGLFKDIPRGAWVAISKVHDRVVAHGFELKQVHADAKNSGENEPLLIRVPEASVLVF